jgi:uncharacterized membrane protein
LCHIWDAKTRKTTLSDANNHIHFYSEKDSKPWMREIEMKLSKLAVQGLVISKKHSGDLDVTLGIQHLSDIAVRALFPGINDPQSAIQRMDVLSSLLVLLAELDLGVPDARDANDNVRLCAPRQSCWIPFAATVQPISEWYDAASVLIGDLGAILTRARRLDRVPAAFAQLE